MLIYTFANKKEREMKKFIVATIFASTLSFDSEAYHVACIHNSSTANPHYESWSTNFPMDDDTSFENAIGACIRDGGRVIQGPDPEDLE